MADTPSPTILGLPSSPRLRVIELNCAVQFTCRCKTPDLLRMVPNQFSMHHRSAQLHWPRCMKSYISSFTKESLFKLQGQQTGCHHSPIHGRWIANWESSLIQRTSICLFVWAITRHQQLKRQTMTWLESSNSLCKTAPYCAILYFLTMSHHCWLLPTCHGSNIALYTSPGA